MPLHLPIFVAVARLKVNTVFFTSYLEQTSIIVWGVIWLIIAIGFFAGGILVGLVAFKVGPSGLFQLSAGIDLHLAKRCRTKRGKPALYSNSWGQFGDEIPPFLHLVYHSDYNGIHFLTMR